jgi:aspartyl/glutamyl-tRNA(Asn/Gln) amidotransferase C subunit
MKFTKEMVDDYANKLLIGLTDEENEAVLKEFDLIDQEIDIINSIPNISDVEPMTHCLDDFETRLREDVPTESPSIDELLKNTKNKMGREVEVPKVVG